MLHTWWKRVGIVRFIFLRRTIAYTYNINIFTAGAIKVSQCLIKYYTLEWNFLETIKYIYISLLYNIHIEILQRP